MQIAEFDAKRETLICVVDEAQIKTIQKIKVKVTDKEGNNTEFNFFK